MKLQNIKNIRDYDPDKFIAEELIEGDHSNVRVIKLASGIALPSHTHAESEISAMLATRVHQARTLELVDQTSVSPHEFNGDGEAAQLASSSGVAAKSAEDAHQSFM